MRVDAREAGGSSGKDEWASDDSPVHDPAREMGNAVLHQPQQHVGRWEDHPGEQGDVRTRKSCEADQLAEVRHGRGCDAPALQCEVDICTGTAGVEEEQGGGVWNEAQDPGTGEFGHDARGVRAGDAAVTQLGDEVGARDRLARLVEDDGRLACIDALGEGDDRRVVREDPALQAVARSSQDTEP